MLLLFSAHSDFAEESLDELGSDEQAFEMALLSNRVTKLASALHAGVDVAQLDDESRQDL